MHYLKSSRIPLALLPLLALSVVKADNLWIDHNPYHPLAQIAQGAVLKLIVDEPVLVEYEYEKAGDEKGVIKMVPDKSVTDFLPAFSSEKTVTANGKVRIRSKGRVKFRTGVSVQASPVNGVLRFTARRRIAYEEGRARQEIAISGSVSVNDVSSDRTIKSEDVADLEISVTGFPVPQRKDIQLKTLPAEGENEPPLEKAELSEGERQRLLLEYLNRVLGESLNE